MFILPIVLEENRFSVGCMQLDMYFFYFVDLSDFNGIPLSVFLSFLSSPYILLLNHCMNEVSVVLISLDPIWMEWMGSTGKYNLPWEGREGIQGNGRDAVALLLFGFTIFNQGRGRVEFFPSFFFFEDIAKGSGGAKVG